MRDHLSFRRRILWVMSGRQSKRLRASQQVTPRAPYGVRRTVETPISGSRTGVKGSDVKQTTHGECALCGQNVQLELGHIVPRWAGKWLKDEGYVLGNYDSLGVYTRSQDIPKHYLMCRACENFLGMAEGYLANIVRGTRSDLAARSLTLIQEDAALIRLDGVDAGLVIRALVGVLFKAHFSPHHMYRHVRLPGWALKEVVHALQQDEYSPNRVSVIALKIMNLTVPGANPRARIDADLRQFGAGIGLVVRFGGFVFVVHVGARERFALEEDMRSLRSDDTSMWIGIGEFTYEPGILPEEAFSVPRTSKGYVLPADPCPCGMELPFTECCQGRWLATRTRYLDVPNEASRKIGL